MTGGNQQFFSLALALVLLSLVSSSIVETSTIPNLGEMTYSAGLYGGQLECGVLNANGHLNGKGNLLFLSFFIVLDSFLRYVLLWIMFASLILFSLHRLQRLVNFHQQWRHGGLGK